MTTLTAEQVADDLKDLHGKTKFLETDAQTVRSIIAGLQDQINSLQVQQDNKGERHGQLKIRDAEKFLPETWSGEKGAIPFAEFSTDMENYINVLMPEGGCEGILEWAAKRDLPISAEEVKAEAVSHPMVTLLNAHLKSVLLKCTTGTAKTMVKEAFVVVLNLLHRFAYLWKQKSIVNILL